MGSQEPTLRMVGIDKSFPGVHALDHVDFDLMEGEVHVLLGENGAGKSTLMKILSGSLAADSGRIFIRGSEVRNLTPERARELGVGMVYQELSLVPALTVAENIFLGRPHRTRWGTVAWREMYAQAARSLEELGVAIDPRTEVRRLSVAEQQLTEIARVLAAQPKIVLLDEPTSALSDAERERLFACLQRMRGLGVGIVYISHRLAEVPMIGQRVTVLRDGKVMGTLPVEHADEDTLVRMMVGRRLAERVPTDERKAGKPLLRVEGLVAPPRVQGVSLEVREGEILGIFGLMGAGQSELCRAIFALERVESGSVWVGGRRVHIGSPREAIGHGIGLLTSDRREGLVPALPIPPNITLATVSQRGMLEPVGLAAEAATARRYLESLRIQPARLDRPVLYLSGGNQQKVVLARWLCSGAKVLIFDEPTRGIDVGAKAEVFALIHDLRRRGVGIVMVSSEMPEILAMADRILVMRRGRIAAELPAAEATQEQLLRCAS